MIKGFIEGFIIILLIISIVLILSMLYCRQTKKEIEIFLPIWINTYFYILITTDFIKVGIMYI